MTSKIRSSGGARRALPHPVLLDFSPRARVITSRPKRLIVSLGDAEVSPRRRILFAVSFGLEAIPIASSDDTNEEATESKPPSADDRETPRPERENSDKTID